MQYVVVLYCNLILHTHQIMLTIFKLYAYLRALVKRVCIAMHDTKYQMYMIPFSIYNDVVHSLRN